MLLKRPLLRVFFLASLCAFISAVPACVEEAARNPQDVPSMHPAIENAGEVITCDASLSPGELRYALTTDGKLALSPGTPREVLVAPLDAAPGSLVGRWLLIDKTEGEVQLRAELRIGLDEFSVSASCTARGLAVIASVSSPASFDDDSLFLFEAASKTVEIR